MSMENQFLKVFDTLIKNIIIVYFIKNDWFSNQSKELNHLLMCCKTIEKSFSHKFKSRYLYVVREITELNSLECAKNIRLDCNKSLTNCSLPNSLTSLSFGWIFNQSLTKGIFP